MKKVKYLWMPVFLFMLLSVAVTGKDSKAALKLSKATLTFASPTARSQTVTIKGLKASNVKKFNINNGWKEWVSIKRKGKNKLVVTPKRSGKLTYSLDISVQYKKPVKGAYSDYVAFKKITIKGSSTIPIKTAADLCNMKAGTYKGHKWKYYLANDIDMTGKGMAKTPGEWGSETYTDIYLDGKGHSIKSDTPIFNSVSGVIKNVVFDVNIKCTTSKKDKNTKIWAAVHYNGYGGLAPIVYNNGQLIGCKSKGSITVNMDADVEYTMSGGGKGKITEANIGGLVEENCNGEAIIKQCRSDVDITINFSNNVSPFTYIGGIVAENYGYSGNKQYATVRECVFSGNLKINDQTSFVYAGGIAGKSNGYIYDCLNTGTVHSDSGSFPWAAGIEGGGGGPKVERALTVGSVNYGIYGQSIYESSLEDDKFNSRFKDVYYLKSKSDGFNYSGNAFEVPGVHGVDDAGLKNQSTFAGFDFDKIWQMGENGPELRNVPA